MKVLFVRPKPLPSTIGLQHLMIVEPLELEILATLIQEDHEVEIVDMILEKKSISHFLTERKPDVLCLTGYITHIPVIIEYCLTAKKINNKLITIVGGVHIEKYPEDIDNISIDYRVVRNATRAFPKLINYLYNGSEFPVEVLRFKEKLNEKDLPDYDFYVPIPDRSLTQKYRNRYFYVFHNKVALIKTSFGCPYTCHFCFCREITGGSYYERPLNEVITELQSIKEKEIYIVDDDFLLNPQRIREFIRLLKEHKINKKFLVYGRADFIASYPEIIKDFKNCGLRTVIVGLESFQDIELKEFNKKTTENINKLAMSVLNHNNIDCYAAVIISPSWNQDEFKKARKIMNELKIKFVNLQPLTPLKGIRLEIDEEKLIVNRSDFARWDLAHVTIRPEKMSIEDFYKNILDLYLKIVLNPRNLISHLKYPLYMYWKMTRGMYKVKKQYKIKIMEVTENA
jgi:hopanoid C-3 methylase